METVCSWLDRQVRSDPTKRAVFDRRQTFSYGELGAASDWVAGWLRQGGTRPGDRVILAGRNRAEYVAAIFGVLKSRAAVVPVSTSGGIRRLSHAVGDTEPTAVIVDDDGRALLGELSPRLKVPVLGMADIALHKNANAESEAGHALPPITFGSDPISTDLAAIMFTSGTTREPLGVVSYHGNIRFATNAINSVIGNGPTDVILCGVPFSFDYGLYQVFLSVGVGATLFAQDGFRVPAAVAGTVVQHGVTGLPAVPSLLAMMLRGGVFERTPMPTLRYVTSTGDVLPTAHIERIRQLVPAVRIYSMYGLTECKRVSILAPEDLDSQAGSVGRPLPGTRCSLLRDDGAEIPTGEGLLLVRGPHVMGGYWNAPGESDARFKRDQLSGEMVLHTFDRFRISADGYLYYLGRDEQVIKRNGLRIGAPEVESAIARIPGVSEVAVVGIPDADTGEMVVAVISSDEVERLGGAPDVATRIASDLPKDLRPDFLVSSQETMPHTPNGKIDRKAIRRSLVEVEDRDRQLWFRLSSAAK